MEELQHPAVFHHHQQQQQPLDFRTTSTNIYESMSSSVNSSRLPPLLNSSLFASATAKTNPSNLAFLQFLQSNPALLNEYIRVNSVASAASAGGATSTTTTIPINEEINQQQQQQQQQRMLNNQRPTTTVNNRIMSTSNGNGSVVNNTIDAVGLHMLTTASAAAVPPTPPTSHDLIEPNLQNFINQEFLRIIFRHPEFLTMFADPNVNKLIQLFAAQNQLQQQQQLQQQHQQQLLLNSLAINNHQANINYNYLYMDQRSFISSKNMKGLKSSLVNNSTSAKFANLANICALTPTCDYDPEEKDTTSSCVSSSSCSVGGPNMSSSSSSSVESYDSKSSCGGSSVVMMTSRGSSDSHHHHHKQFIPYKKRASAAAAAAAAASSTSTMTGDDHHSSASSISSDAASPNASSSSAINGSGGGMIMNGDDNGLSTVTVSSQAPVMKKPANDQPQHKKIKRCPHVWQFCCDLLENDKYNPHIIKWLNKDKGIFKIVKPDKVAELWGMQKNRKSDKKMNYEKMARGMRYSRREGFFKKLDKEKNKPNEYGKQLVFQFSEKVVNNMECKWKFAI